MVEIYTKNKSGLLVEDGEAITFDTATIKTCSCASVDTPTNTIHLNKEGIYQISFNAIIANSASSSDVINVSMYNKGVEVQQALAGVASSSSDDVENISFSTILRVRPSCEMIDNTTDLQFILSGTDALVYFANVDVIKVS
jgi:hypothetical protein